MMHFNWHVRVAPVRPESLDEEKREDFAISMQFYRTHDIYVAAPTAELAMQGALQATVDEQWDLTAVYLQRKEPLARIMVGDV